MTHDHDWIDVTTMHDLDRKFICAGCDARKSGGSSFEDPLDSLSRDMKDCDNRMVGAAFDAAKDDGWDGMRRFLQQMDPSNNFSDR